MQRSNGKVKRFYSALVTLLLRHDREAKAKQEKAQRIKRMNQEISKIKLEIEKYNDALADCTKYQKFLDKLTPQSWFEEQEQLKVNATSVKVYDFVFKSDMELHGVSIYHLLVYG